MKPKDLSLAEALAVLNHYKMPYTYYREDDHEMEFLIRRPSWDGETLAVSDVTEPDTVVHELGHWLVCPAERRDLPEFGLGSSFRSHADTPNVVNDTDLEEKEENEACAFGIATNWRLGRKWHGTADSVQWQGHKRLGWEAYVSRTKLARETIDRLIAKRLFRGFAPIKLPPLTVLQGKIKRAEKEISVWKLHSSSLPPVSYSTVESTSQSLFL